MQILKHYEKEKSFNSNDQMFDFFVGSKYYNEKLDTYR